MATSGLTPARSHARAWLAARQRADVTCSVASRRASIGASVQPGLVKDHTCFLPKSSSRTLGRDPFHRLRRSIARTCCRAATKIRESRGFCGHSATEIREHALAHHLARRPPANRPSIRSRCPRAGRPAASAEFPGHRPARPAVVRIGAACLQAVFLPCPCRVLASSLRTGS